MYIAITDRELDGLRGADYSLLALYMYLKQFMDYKTGLVGYERRISYQSISEALYIEPRPGVKGGSPHKSAIRRMIDQLIKLNIIKKSRQDTLVFKLHLVDLSFYDHKKPDTKPTHEADTSQPSKQAISKPKADTPKKVKADTPHYSLNTINKATTTESQQQSDQVAGSSSHLIFSKRLDTKTQQTMQNLVKDFDLEQQQELIDEVQGCIERGKVQVTPIALLQGMVKRCKDGAFNPNYAPKVKIAREQRIEAAAQPAPKPVKRGKPSTVTKLTDYLGKKTA